MSSKTLTIPRPAFCIPSTMIYSWFNTINLLLWPPFLIPAETLAQDYKFLELWVNLIGMSMENTTLSLLICMVHTPEMFHAAFQALTSFSTGSALYPDLLDLGTGWRLSPRTTLLSSWENWELLLSHPSQWEFRLSRGTARLINILMSLLCLSQNWLGQRTGWD